MTAVIYERTPAELGWLPMGNRTWELYDGTIYQFPPGAPERVKVFRKLSRDEIIDIDSPRTRLLDRLSQKAQEMGLSEEWGEFVRTRT
jgi:hypothetical protein